MGFTRRSALRLSGVALGSGLTGCIGSTTSEPESSTESPPQTADELQGDCTEYVYQSTGQEADGPLPEDLYIRNINLSRVPVSISITDLSEESPEELVSCTLTSGSQTVSKAKLEFGLSSETRYRVQVSLEGRDATATTEIMGDLASNEALEVTVENGELRIQKFHID
jgi:hypothetical protein